MIARIFNTFPVHMKIDRRSKRIHRKVHKIVLHYQFYDIWMNSFPVSLTYRFKLIIIILYIFFDLFQGLNFVYIATQREIKCLSILFLNLTCKFYIFGWGIIEDNFV